MLQQVFGQLGAGLDDMLAVVQHQQQVLFAQLFGQRRQHALVGLVAHPQHQGDGLVYQGRVGQRGQLDQPHAVGIAGQELAGGL